MVKQGFAFAYAILAAVGIAVGNDSTAPANRQPGIGDAVGGREEKSGSASQPQTLASETTEPSGGEQTQLRNFPPPASPSQPQSETAPTDPAGAGATQIPKKPPANPYKGVFYDNDFSYLDDPANEYYFLGDFMKRRRLWNSVILDVGGEYRLRQHNEHILTRNNNFLLQRTRIYGDLHVDDWFRTYIEAIDATSAWENLPPRPTDENRFDALNLFGDARIVNGDRGDLWLRGGRQELLYGAQRLISPLDWVNTRRTFDGVKLFWRGESWNVDGFWTIGGGRKLESLDWHPVLWVYYDWASGDRNPTDGIDGTFNQLFPLGHQYLGWMDIVGRQNIEDWNFRLTLTPRTNLEFILWWHIFHLQQARDALYDASGIAIRQDPTGAAGTDVGNEADLTLRWTFRPRADVLFGYSHMFPGRFLLDTPGGANGRDFYYTQFSLRF